MTQTPDARTVLTGMYAAEVEYLNNPGHASSGWELLAGFFAEDVRLHQAETLPYGGTWVGHDGMQRFFEAMGRTWEAFELLEQEFLAESATTAVVLSQVRARSRRTGREGDFPILQRIDVADGRITDVRPFYWDTAAVSALCRD